MLTSSKLSADTAQRACFWAFEIASSSTAWLELLAPCVDEDTGSVSLGIWVIGGTIGGCGWDVLPTPIPGDVRWGGPRAWDSVGGNSGSVAGGGKDWKTLSDERSDFCPSWEGKSALLDAGDGKSEGAAGRSGTVALESCEGLCRRLSSKSTIPGGILIGGLGIPLPGALVGAFGILRALVGRGGGAAEDEREG